MEVIKTASCLIVEDLATTADWLEGIVAQTFPHLQVQKVATVSAALAYLEHPLAVQPLPLALALVDLGLPDGSGIRVLRSLAQRYPSAMPVVTTIYDDEAHVFDALSAGARGYLLKENDASVMVEYLRRIERGEPPLSPSIALRLLKHFQTTGAVRQVAAEPQPQLQQVPLSKREEETLRLIAQGLTVAESARELGLSAQTVAGYVKSIYQKLHISSRAQATREALKRGFV